ncbi:lysylphosphatidylglycerol synthase domain-containing protein [Occallatibacter riparius]|uniref:Lysylphosphatidylglycerol synthase domain-containing protein n=1 Tax=Occallatibacter riparius TaxID=1002689 RepID=A0A9J7BRI6_9BACT|nr:lysylphosphatidylglycerol synthase domain-containing protein [Occallatibacter riparius]UWZ85193.1 lysylphosphatidylglycerol synthase domain-containing protein [Occallatibacter riparius]
MKRVQLIIACGAVMLLAWVIAHAGISTMLGQLTAMRVALPLVIALSLLRLTLQSVTWSASLKGENIAVDRRTLVGVRVASQAMGYLTVLGPALSEPMKIKLLGTSSDATITATFLDTGVYWLTSVLIAISGLACLPLFAVHGTAYHWLPAVLILGLAVLAITRRDSVLAHVVRACGKRTPSWLVRAERWERAIRRYRLEQPGLVSRMFWIGMACQLLIVLEVFIVLWSLHLPVHVVAVMAIEGVTRALKLASGWIPARIGADEGGAISAFSLVGLSPMLGLSLALTRRARDLIWALSGILWLAWTSRRSRVRDPQAFAHSTAISEGGL